MKMRAMAVSHGRLDTIICFNCLLQGKFSMKTITHDSSKIDGYLVFSSLGMKKELMTAKNQKNRYKKDATIEKRTILI